jgi:hypothetical protein
MPEIAGETERERSRRGNLFAVRRRLERNRDFFDHVWELQPKFMAIFGRETEDIFLLLHTARRDIEVACEMLEWMKEPEASIPAERDLLVQLRRDIWSSTGEAAKEENKVGTKLEDFRTRIEALCRPLIDRELGGATRGATMAAFAKWWRGS